MIKTSALVSVKDNKILLVRVRENTVWYFPGGKIDIGETPEQTLLREVYEELDIILDSSDLKYLGEVIADNHDRTDIVSVECFSGELNGTIKPCAEISEIKWFDLSDTDLMAPAVIETINRWF